MNELYTLIDRLINCWSCWAEHEKYYLGELLPRLKNGDFFSCRATATEKDLITEIKAVATDDDWNNLEIIVQQVRRNKSKHRLILNKIKAHLEQFDFDSAKELFAAYPGAVSESEYNQLRSECQKKYVTERIVELLDGGKYPEADDFFFKNPLLSKSGYESIKSQYVKRCLESNGIQLDDEKALAIAKTDKNVLLTARAGSGKTTTIACKTVFIIEHEAVKPDEIMILAFNKKAAEEIRRRVRSEYKLEHFENARTFHSLAYQIVQPKEELLFDSHGEFSRKLLSEFVQRIVKRIWNPVFRQELYVHFRKELRGIERSGVSLSNQEYLLYRRNLRQITLRGERVKSLGEKYIADFLCEHGIEYQYERVHFWGKKNYRPDFTLLSQEREVIIEHWGIDEKDPKKQVQEHWTLTWDEYLCNMNEKRSYWRQRKAIFIETSIKDLSQGREHFENILKSRLEKAGIKCKKLSEDEILKKVIDPQIARITELFVQFIQKAKKNEFTVEDIQRNIEEHDYDERVKVFLELANKVYSDYNEALQRDKKIDFDDLIMKATWIIDETKGECEIPIDKNKIVKIRNLKWILIDEYQDFSKLFYHLIQSIRKHNNDLRLFCVGDNWQAINGFAGSDLKYFDNFTTLIEDSGTANLLTNYRSHKDIVETSNRLMRGRGEPSRPNSNKSDGEIRIEYIDDVYVEARNALEYTQERKRDEKFIFMNDSGFLKAKYLKKCYEIITQSAGKTVAILARTHWIYNSDLENEFYHKLKKCFSADELAQIGEFEGRIKIGTAHSFKGLEADVVVILQACNGSFPLIHPDNQLFEIFGETIRNILYEEMRLFYVAITRAKEKIFILTEKDRESDYLDLLKP